VESGCTMPLFLARNGTGFRGNATVPDRAPLAPLVRDRRADGATIR
jgi:hypothetical protein